MIFYTQFCFYRRHRSSLIDSCLLRHTHVFSSRLRSSLIDSCLLWHTHVFSWRLRSSPADSGHLWHTHVFSGRLISSSIDSCLLQETQVFSRRLKSYPTDSQVFITSQVPCDLSQVKVLMWTVPWHHLSLHLMRRTSPLGRLYYYWITPGLDNILTNTVLTDIYFRYYTIWFG